MLRKKNIFIIFLVLFSFGKTFSQPVKDSLATPNPTTIKEYKQQAYEFYNSFKNGPAFEFLQKYGELKEKELNKQKEEDLQRLESKFKTDYSRRQQELKDIQQAVDVLQNENDSLEKEKQKLTRNTILFFFIFISFLAGVLISRVKLAAKAQSLAETSAIQLNRTLKLVNVSEYVSKMHKDIKFGFNSVFELSTKSIAVLAKLKSIAVSQKKGDADFQKFELALGNIYNNSEKSVLSIVSLEQPLNETEEEKVSTNLNNLISEVFDLSFHWIKSFDESFECEKVKDLEKILPEINIMPVSIHIALFHFFNNAFYSIYEKKKNAGKNYAPKITVTSRKLPRFVQIRIKDNGSGIEDKILSEIYMPFFTTKSPEVANGLGLSHAAQIIKKTHGGEIIIESEAGNGTDFIIRFPINPIT